MKRYFILYRDKDAQQYEGDAWNAQSFEDQEEADEFVEDLNSAESVWAGEAVAIIRTTLNVADVFYLEVAEG